MWRRWMLVLLGLGAAGAVALTRPFGALSGLVKLTSKKPPLGLCFWGSVPGPAWTDYLRRFDFASAKIMDGRHESKPEFWRLVRDECQAAGIPFHAWGYHYMRTPEAAQAEGFAAAELSQEAGARVYWVNAEREWLGIHGSPPVADPIGSMVAFVDAFRDRAPGVDLAYNSMTGYMAKSIQAQEVELLELFDIYAPMVYSANKSDGARATLRKKWGRAYGLAQAAGRPWCPMLGTGRIAKNGMVWGNLETTLELQEEMPADWITFWIGPQKDGSRFEQPNAVNVSLLEFAEAAHA